MARKTGKKPTKVDRSRPKAAVPTVVAAPQAPPPVTALPAVIPPRDFSPPERAEIALIQRQAKQRIRGIPKSGKIRNKVVAIVSLKLQGFSTVEIGEQLGLKPASIRQYMWIAGKNGWLTTADPHDVADNILVHRVVSNLEELLHSRNVATGLPDKEVTLEAAKGFGIFKDHTKAEAPAAQQANVLTINFQFPKQDGPLPTVRAENVGGSPAYIDAEVVSRGE